MKLKKMEKRTKYGINFSLIGITLTILCSCDYQKKPEKLFSLLAAKETGVDFINQLEYDEDFNIYTYRNFYNGGGVALGDIDNDGWMDMYLTANMGPNKLYRNTGDFQFEDISEKAGVIGEKAWSTGVTMADINGDGWMDIYVCNSGDVDGDNKQNELFINQQNGTFREMAEQYGLDDRGLSTHAAFFDYDKDGDLDMYLLNNSYQAIGSFNLMRNERPNRDSVGGDKLYKNTGNFFEDVSEQAGIFGSIIGFGLGVTVGDVNKDGWEDIFVSNDFFERDYLYINNQNGTFKEELTNQMKSVSAASMGADMADLNHDGYPEIFVTDMLPETNERMKTVTTFEDWDKYQYKLKNGYYHQFIRNMLHLNNRNNTFSEIARLAGMEATDWSWGALIFDFENDGNRDIFIANGIYQDLTNQDYLQYISNEETMRMIVTDEGVNYKKLIDLIPINKIHNYAFMYDGNYHYSNKSDSLGLATPSHSNGAAYGDLDNDGDLDLVVNNVNMPSFIYRNESEKLIASNHIKFQLIGSGKNTQAIGTQITAYYQKKQQYIEQINSRGFQSSVDPRPILGLGNIDKVDSIKVRWPNGKYTVLRDIAVNQTLTLRQGDGIDLSYPKDGNANMYFKDVTDRQILSANHTENNFVDFDRDRLIYHMLSTEGPPMCKGDINGDGLTDLFIGGAKDSPASIHLQSPNGIFRKSIPLVFKEDQLSEDTDCVFFDVDNDDDLDLYIASGGSEFPNSSSALIDRLYLNDGKGNFEKSEQVLPTTRYESTSTVEPFDYDNDGDMDLFVGIRHKPFSYGIPVSGYILTNNQGKLENNTEKTAPGLTNIGMITDAKCLDYDKDNDMDLILVGEWMPITIFENQNNRFVNVTRQSGLQDKIGWWNKLAIADLNNDGLMDLVIGNHGTNSRFKASEEKPVSMFFHDFDQNGTAEQIITAYNGDESYPLALKHDLIKQMPGLKKKYLKYESFKDQTVFDIFPADQIERAVKNKATHLQTAIAINKGDGSFELRDLPVEAQFSPVYAILTGDFNQDNNIDILLAGNFYNAKPEIGRYDASYGTLFTGDGEGNFSYLSNDKSGLKIDGQVREMIPIVLEGKNVIIIGRNNQDVQILERI